MVASQDPAVAGGQHSWAERLRARTREAIIQPVSTGPLSPEQLFAPAPMALYVHVPFCASRCAYCCFNTVRREPTEMAAYVEALGREAAMHAARPEVAAHVVSSVYLGGGTPSSLAPELVERLMASLRGAFALGPELQITMEANPESVTAEAAERWLKAGVNRISLGVQSFDEARLRSLGRRHDRRTIHAALAALRSAAVPELSLDLIFGFAGQNAADLRRELQEATATGVDHLSVFPLSYQPGTALQRSGRRWAPLVRLYRVVLHELEAARYRAYTTEDFTRGRPCHYQTDVWGLPPRACLGLGAGALSSMSGVNWHNVGQLDSYLTRLAAGRLPVAGGGVVSPRDQMLGHLHIAMKSLRFEPRLFAERFGVSVERAFGPLPQLARASGLARRAPDGAIVPTSVGRYLVSRLWSEHILAKLATVAATSD